MTREELAEHLVRVGGKNALARELPCSRTTVRKWTHGGVSVSARWAERIRSLPDPPPRAPLKDRSRGGAAAHAACAPRQLPLPFAPPAMPLAAPAKARARRQGQAAQEARP